MPTPLSIFTADLHGNDSQYKRLLEYVQEIQPEFLFLAGDLLPKKGGLWRPGHPTRNVEAQREYILNTLNPFLLQFAKTTEVYLIFGNDDFALNIPEVVNHPRIHLLNNSVERLDDTFMIAGYPYVSLTPFLQKDWEKIDSTEGNEFKAHTKQGFIATENSESPIDFSSKTGRGTIHQDLERLAKQSDPRKTVYLIHEPPYDTNLDMTTPENPYLLDGNTHIGSKAIHRFIEEHQPYLTLHGHIHETVDVSGEYVEKIGDSTSVSSGNTNTTESIAILVFNLNDLSTLKRIIL